MVKLPSMMKGWLNPGLNSEQLMRRYSASGNNKWLCQLVDKHNHDIYHFLLTQSDKNLAEDVVQSTWLKVIDKRQYFTAQTMFKAWLYRIARNTLVDELRRLQRWQYDTVEMDQLESELISSDPANAIDQQDNLQQRFNLLLEQLPFLQREAFVLQQDGFSIAEIASICGEQNETIKSRLRYARNYFKRHLEHLND
ncbi:sigma-70 family RNA polymerase sigma factor [Thalassotalea crassostreae]|uniref:sigma-70 family RNA polymerase sigma factor n=1 Tax=Thalassotalea crassostreae TaxID=1763536 RepID=UPI001D03FFE5|nr:sigma-70 family RNA polymerase sigma factor [Thalassotalea crassostreae]